MLIKILKIAFPIILILTILFIGYNSYKQVTEDTESPLNIIPTNAAVIFQCNKADKLYASLNDIDSWRYLCNISLLDSINNHVQEISDFYNQHPHIFKSHTLFISFHKVGVDNSGLLFSSNFERQSIANNIQINNLLGKTISEGEYNNQPLFELQHQGGILFVSFKGDIVFFSRNKMLVEDAIRASEAEEKLLLNKSFNSAYKTINKSAEINLFFNYNSLIEYVNIFTNKVITTSHFSGWTATDLSAKDKMITANGFSAFNNNTLNYTDIFNGQSAESINIVDIIPESTTFLLSIGFDNAKQLFDQKNRILQQQNNFWSWDKHRKRIEDSSNVNYNELINELQEEAGVFNTSTTQSLEQQYTFFKTDNSITAISLMQGLISNRGVYAQYSINSINDPNITAQLFGDLFNNNTPYFIIINDYFIFGPTIASLEYLIDNYRSENTLDNSLYFKNYKNYFSSRSNLFFYINPGKIATTLKDRLEDSFQRKVIFNTDSIIKFTAFSVQMIVKKNLLLNSINLFYDSDFQEVIKEEWFKYLDTNISMKPQFVYNHFIKEEMIIVQNDDNKLFAVNSKGEQIWSLQIDSKIIGNISSVDVYQNNKYQYLFNTDSQLYLIDRHGENVEGFPKVLPSITTIGHSLFDYNNTKKYRIIIIGEDNNIYNLDKRGETVKGWKYSKDIHKIKQSPTHFRVGANDYILVECNNSNMQLLAINGSERVSFENGIQFNGNPIQIDKNGVLYAITNEGKLWRGTLDGNSNQISLPDLTSSSLFIIKEKGTEKEFIYTNKRSIFIVDANFEEVYSFEMESNITNLLIDNKGLVITTGNKLYLWDTDKITDGFPIATDGFFNISDIDKNGKTNILNTKNGFIYNYQLAD